MRRRLQNAPWWALALIQGTLFGVGMAVFWRVLDADAGTVGPGGLIILALVTGIPFGLIMGPIIARMNRRAVAAAGLDDPDEMVTINRAVTRGPAPTDPRLRTAARNLACHRLDELRRRRVVNLSVFGVGTLGYAVAAVVWSPWWALAAVMFAAFLTGSLILPGRLERRIDLLADGPDGTPPV